MPVNETDHLPVRPTPIRPHLEIATEARRRGDHPAAELHATDALIARRAAPASVQAMEAGR